MSAASAAGPPLPRDAAGDAGDPPAAAGGAKPGLPAAAPDRIDVLLQPGDHFVGCSSHRVRTVLGSCVSVTLWAPHVRIGAMSHFMLSTRAGTPARPDAAPPAPHGLDARYGDEALALMLHDLLRKGVRPQHCQAKIFGGGAMFPDRALSGVLAVGRRNGEAARRLVQAHGIDVVSESLFGEGYRQIIFDIGCGAVWSRQVRPHSEPDALA